MSNLKIPGRISMLFLGGAKRVAMARMFKDAAAKRGLECKIVGYELDAHSALAMEGLIVEGLRWKDPNILNNLNSVVKQHNIDIIIPFVDPAVGVAADYVETTTSSTFAPVAKRCHADKMFDKVAAAELFEANNIPIPATWKQGDKYSTPLIAKPRFGSASKGIIEINSQQELDDIINKSDYLIQERIDRREEITIDCYAASTNGKIVCTSPRIRREVAGGEAVRTITIADNTANTLAQQVIETANLCGAITVQLIRDLDNNRLLVMEVNPRLGGGAVASVHAGADIPGLIIDDCLGATLYSQQPTAGVETVRYLADVVFFP